ncbi:MAG: FkbM family methyltransferase [Acidobacteriota bacterium]
MKKKLLGRRAASSCPWSIWTALHLVVSMAIAMGILGCVASKAEVSAHPDDNVGKNENARHRILLTETKRYSQNDEELIIRDFFEDRRGGVFLDVGAGPWKHHSTTLYLEKHLGWTGISVDALKRYRRGYEKHRPGTRFEAYAVTDQSGGTIPFYVAGDVSSTDSTWKDRFRGTRDREPRVVEVPQITLNDLLDGLEVKKIDFLSMDIEGGEKKALAGFDIARFAPELVCIEMNESEKAQALVPYFESHGYEMLTFYRAYDRVNRYFARRSASD